MRQKTPETDRQTDRQTYAAEFRHPASLILHEVGEGVAGALHLYGPASSAFTSCTQTTERL